MPGGKGKGGKGGKGNNFDLLIQDAKRIKLEEEKKEAEERDSHDEGRRAAVDFFDEVMSSASPLNVLGEYDWMRKNLPELLDNAEKELLQKVHDHMKIEQMKKVIGSDSGKVGHKGKQFPILDSLSCKLGISLRHILAPPTHVCLLCNKKLQRNNHPTQAALHTLDGPQLATKYSYA